MSFRLEVIQYIIFVGHILPSQKHMMHIGPLMPYIWKSSNKHDIYEP